MGNCQDKSCKNRLKAFCGKKIICTACQKCYCHQCFYMFSPDETKEVCWRCHTYIEAKEEWSRSDSRELESEKCRFIIRNHFLPIKMDPFSSFDNLGVLGIGAFSTVFKVKNKDDGKTFALKVIEMNKMTEENILEEYSKAAMCPCESIVKCYALYDNNKSYSILMELMSTTLDKIIKSKHLQSEKAIAYIILQITRGLLYIHSGKNVHRDLKTGNILINSLGDVKIGDFGFSSYLSLTCDQTEGFIGSPLWTAPEMLQGTKVSFKCDIWSLGIICYELAEKKIPNQRSRSITELIHRVNNSPAPKINEAWSEEFKEFVESCLVLQPECRKSCKELIQSRFLTGVVEDEGREIIREIVKEFEIAEEIKEGSCLLENSVSHYGVQTEIIN